jgi:hypothetical protein
MRHPAAVALTAGLLLAGSVPACAQLVRGRTLAPLDSNPVPGVLVQLVDSVGGAVAQGFSDRHGSFTITAPRSATYTLRGLRIGWRPSTSVAFTVPAAGMLTQSLVMSGSVVALAAERISATSACVASSDSTGAGFDAWEQARQALVATRATRSESSLKLRWVLFERRADVRTDSILDDEERDGETTALRPFQAVSVEHIANDGYVTRGADGPLFMAPDEEVLLSTGFAESHCIRLVAQPQDADSVVIAFEPNAERTVAEIAGAFVLERASGALRRMTFRYVHVLAAEEAARAGGAIHFRPLPLGRWLIDRWSLRLPVIVQRSVRGATSSSTLAGVSNRTEQRDVLVAMQTTGGQIYWARDGERVLWSEGTTTVHGRVVDSSGVALRGGSISLPGTSASAGTDSTGVFTLPDVRLGRRVLAIRDAYRDSIGVGPFTEPVDVDGSASEVLILTPTRDAVVASVCGAAARDATPSGWIRGVVRDAFGSPVANAEVTVTWAGAAVVAKATSSGQFLVCDAPLDTDLRIVVRIGARSGGSVTTRIVAGIGFVLTEVGTHPDQ